MLDIDIDLEDAILGSVFMMAAAVSSGLATVEIVGFDLASEIVSISGIGIAAAPMLSTLSLAGAYATNRVQSSPNKQYEVSTNVDAIIKGDATIETYVVLATLASIVVMVVDPMGIADTIQGSILLGAVVLAVQSAGYYVVSYINCEGST